MRNRCRNKVIISHININSLRHKFHDLSDLFSDRQVDILFISETKLDSTFTQAQFDAPGYNSFRKDRNCHGGGLLAYIRSGAKTIKKNTNSTQNKSETHRVKQYEVTSFLSTDCELSTDTCSKNVYSLGP